MNSTNQIILTGYRVRYVDLRAPKPRSVKETVCVLSADQMDALGLLGQNPVAEIEHRFERTGYHVIAVEKRGKRVIYLDLAQLWNDVKNGDAPAEEVPAE